MPNYRQLPFPQMSECLIYPTPPGRGGAYIDYSKLYKCGVTNALPKILANGFSRFKPKHYKF